ALRGAIAAVAVGGFLLALRQVPLPRGDELLPWSVIGLFNGAIPNVLVAFAMQRMDSGPAVLIQAIGPLLTAVAGHLLFAEERLNARSLAGVAVGFCGVGLLIGPAAFEGKAPLPAMLAMLGVALCYTIGNIYTRNLSHHDPMRLALGQQVASAVFAGLAALTTGGIAAFAGADRHMPALLALGIFCTAVPISVFYRLIVRAGPTRASLAGYTVPAVAVAIGALVLGERLTLWQAAGGLTVLAGVFLVATSKRKAP
ncbi:MAG TPA: DMT family transporter, partial [Beijerinckiaceae bacterium]|nr:DMT family transporter [Beijerinckiaceae bacterium]